MIARPLSLCMVAASGVFWITSWPLLPLGNDFPNCVSVRWDNGLFAVGCLSHHGLSSTFVTLDSAEWLPALIWSERADGHFCGFPISPSREPTNPPNGFNVHVGREAIGWDCPYLLMGFLWLAVFFRSGALTRYRLIDMFAVMSVVSVLATLIRLRLAMLGVIPLNLLTAMLVVFLLIKAVWFVLHDKNLLWPLLLGESKTQSP